MDSPDGSIHSDTACAYIPPLIYRVDSKLLFTEARDGICNTVILDTSVIPLIHVPHTLLVISVQDEQSSLLAVNFRNIWNILAC